MIGQPSVGRFDFMRRLEALPTVEAGTATERKPWRSSLVGWPFRNLYTKRFCTVGKETSDALDGLGR
jgi:hypothetical protein